MKGFITTRDVLLHPYAIVASFGLRVYARCLVRILSGRTANLPRVHRAVSAGSSCSHPSS